MMKLAAIAVNRPMPLPGMTEKTICTAVCMYIPVDDAGGEDPSRAHYAHLHFDSHEKMCEWMATAKLGSPLTTVH